MIDTVRISGAAKDQLVTLKRRTGLKYWNELSRWALCRSLAEPSLPTNLPTSGEAAIEIDWRTFAGRHADLYLDLICQRCVDDGLPVDQASVQRQLHLHLHRGIGYLVGDPVFSRTSEGFGRRRAPGIRDLHRLALTAAPGEA